MRFVSIFALVLVMLPSACKRSPGLVSSEAYIIGANQIVPVDGTAREKIPTDVLASAVVLTTTISQDKRKFCSGTLIDPKSPSETMRVLTNRHCFVADDSLHSNTELLPGHCESTLVFFGFFKNQIADRWMGTCLAGSFRSELDGDLAIFNLSQNPPARFLPAQVSSGDVASGTSSMIVHFPFVDEDDPQKMQKTFYEARAQISIPYGQVTYEDCQLGEDFPEETWSIDRSLRYSFKHTCDQRKGSSGSALWDLETKAIIGINWGGVILRSDGDSQEMVFNVATNPSRIRAFINDKIPADGSKSSSQDASAHVVASSGDQEHPRRCGMISDKVAGWTVGIWLLVPLLLI